MATLTFLRRAVARILAKVEERKRLRIERKRIRLESPDERAAREAFLRRRAKRQRAKMAQDRRRPHPPAD
jgi:hypothetical protein